MEERTKKIVAAAGGLYALRVLVSRKKDRKKWEKEWISRRNAHSHMGLVKELQAEQREDYKNYLRMDEASFEELLRIVTHQLQKQNTVMRECIPPRERLTASLRYLATGQDYEQLKFSTRIAAQTLGRIIPETCRVIFDTLKDTFMKMPQSKEEWRQQAVQFKNKWQMINCGGCIDGKHIRIVKPPDTGATYFNYKKFYSFVLMAIVNADYEIIYADVGKQGRISDGGVIDSTTFYDALNDETLNLPTNEETDEGLNFVFIGDEAFALHEHIRKPYPQRTLNYERRIYNYRIARCRNVVENVFGLMASRFRVLHTSISVATEKAIYVVLAVCVLHNFLIRSNSTYISPQSVDTENSATHDLQPGLWRSNSDDGLEALQAPTLPRFPPLAATNNREAYLKFFNDKGRVSWQDEMIRKGKA